LDNFFLCPKTGFQRSIHGFTSYVYCILLPSKEEREKQKNRTPFMGLTQNANAFWDQPPLFCLKYRRIALFSGRIESPKPLPPKEGRFFYET
ncbi:hypothetical protein P9726_07760, partial [Geobacillus stearothermophilus]|uniref:hypothetical protein n=1 Tax=Geobacillus stearothermophilus TaxID=1422 RepID=UPI002E2473A8|nr:hypothetical protein [Geobacillus stearothermophilus]